MLREQGFFAQKDCDIIRRRAEIEARHYDEPVQSSCRDSASHWTLRLYASVRTRVHHDFEQAYSLTKQTFVSCFDFLQCSLSVKRHQHIYRQILLCIKAVKYKANARIHAVRAPPPADIFHAALLLINLHSYV